MLFVSSLVSAFQPSSLSGEPTGFKPLLSSSDVRADRSGDVSFIWSRDWLALGLSIEGRPKETIFGSGVAAAGFIGLLGESRCGGESGDGEGRAPAMVRD